MQKLDQPSKGNAPLRKRNRPMLSCISCHERRVRCDRGHPCESCIQYGLPDNCTYAARPNKRAKSPINAATSSFKEESNSTLAQYRAALYPKESTSVKTPIMSLTTFVERFQDESQAAIRVGVPPRKRPYPLEIFRIIETARRILPSIERTELMIAFYMEQIDSWMYNVADYDAMDLWLVSYLSRIQSLGLYLDDLKDGDATRLALIVACILASVQIAGEGLVRVFYPDSDSINNNNIQSNPIRQSIKSSHEKQLRTLLDVALQYDGSSPDLIRASLIYHFYLKNEGGHGQEGAGPLMESISRLVLMINMHLEPPADIPEAEAESRRRLFLSYYVFNRVSCITTASGVAIRDHEITIKEPQQSYHSIMLGKRLCICQIFKARLFRSIEGFLEEMKGGVTEACMVRFENYLQSWQKSLPPALDPSLPRLTPSLRTVRAFDLERHLLQATYYISRTTVHRNCFFPNEGISVERVEASRQICIDSALSMVKLQESLRMRIVSDHHLRCLFVPLFTLEAALTLALASLIELSKVSAANVGVPATVQDYMRWAYRGRDLLVTIPTDFTQGVQAVKLVSRVLSKATKIIDLRALQIVSHLDDKSAIREILCDDEGERVDIPLLDSNFTRDDLLHKRAYKDVTRRSSSNNNNNNSSKGFSSNSTPTVTNSSSVGFPTNSSTVSPPVMPQTDYYNINTFNVDGSPTYADLGMDFFNEMAAALQPIRTAPPTVSTSTSTMFPPDPQSQSLDEQLDLWLASLSNVS